MRSDRSQCSREGFGCGQGFHDSDMDLKSGLCKACALGLSRKLRVSLADLPMALFAAGAAKSGRPDLVPGEVEVWTVLDKLNAALKPEHRIKLQDRYIHVPTLPRGFTPSDACLPEGDRQAA